LTWGTRLDVWFLGFFIASLFDSKLQLGMESHSQTFRLSKYPKEQENAVRAVLMPLALRHSSFLGL
jgi:hypothetical protein